MLTIGYFSLVIFIVIWFIVAIIKTNKSLNHNPKSDLIKFGTFITLWIMYVYIVCKSGIIASNSLPPKMPIFLILPIFSMMGYFIFSGKILKYVVHVPKHIPVLFQCFRVLVELLIYGAFLEGLTGIEATFLGYNYEIHFSVFALTVGLIMYFKPIPNKALLIVNIIGLCFLFVIVMIFNTLLVAPQIWGYTSRIIDLKFLDFPYMSIPAVFMPAAVFAHVLSIKQALYKN